MIWREIDDLNGFVIISGHNVTNLRYTDDTILTPESEEKLQTLDKSIIESDKIGFTLNQKRKHQEVS